jgi:hypothetical protein
MPAVGNQGGNAAAGITPSAPVTPTQTAAQQQASALQGLLGPGLALSQAGYQQQGDALQNQAALYGQSTAYQTGLENQSLQQQLAGYGLQSESLGLQEGLTSQQYGLQQQQFGLQGQSLQEQQAQAQTGYQQGLQQLTQGSAASGVLNSGTQRQGETNLSTQLGYTEEQIGNSQAQLGLQQQGAADTNTYQQAQYGVQAKQIDLGSANAQTQAQQAIAQLGLQGQVSTDQVLQQIGALQQGQASTLTGVLPQIISLMTGGT